MKQETYIYILFIGIALVVVDNVGIVPACAFLVGTISSFTLFIQYLRRYPIQHESKKISN